MFNKLFEKKPSTKFDVVMALGAVVMAAFKAHEVISDYKQNTKIEEKNQ